MSGVMQNAKLSVVILALILSACAGAPTIAPLAELDPKNSESSLLIVYKVETTEPTIKDSGCKLDLRHLETGNEYYLRLEVGSHFGHYVLPPGHFRALQFECAKYIYALKDRSDFFGGPGVQVFDGKINIVGGYDLKFFNRHSAQIGGLAEKEWKESIQAALKTFSDSARKRTVSSWTGKTLPLDNTAFDFDKKAMIKLDKITKEDPRFVELEGKLKVCFGNEAKVSPFHFGRTKITGSRVRHAEAEIIVTDHSTRSDAYAKCIVPALKTYLEQGPESSQEIKVSFDL